MWLTVFIRLSALGAYSIFGPWDWALIRGWALIKFSPFSVSSRFILFIESFFKILRKLTLRGSLLVALSQFHWISLSLRSISEFSGAASSCALHFFFFGVRGGGGGGRLFQAGRLLTFPTYRVGAYSRWALIRGWALNRINTVKRSLQRPLSDAHRQAHWMVSRQTVRNAAALQT